MKLPIYLDYHATTPVDPRVLDAMMPYLTTAFGNAGSRSHVFGWEAEAAVEEARHQLASAMNAGDKEIVFTSGATESDHLAIFGVARAYRSKGDHVITGATEHHAVLDTCRALEKEGFRVTFLQPDGTGRISAEQVEEAVTEKTVLVTLMFGNNEIGTVHPIAAIGEVCRRRGVLFHTDAVQGFGKVAFDVESMKVDLASVSGHKIYAPKGVGALYVRSRNPRVRLAPILVGGGQERGMRSGTLNVPGIVALGAAARLSMEELPAEARRLRLLRARLFEGITSELSGVVLNGPPLPRIDEAGNLLDADGDARLPGNLNCSFEGVEGEALVLGMKDIAVSSGSACTSASLQPSHVLRAVGVPDDLAHASIRFGLGRFTTAEEIEFAITAVAATVRRLRAIAPVGAAAGARPAGGSFS
jgi:cysteine desulfurase